MQHQTNNILHPSFTHHTDNSCECNLFTELTKFRRNIEEGRCGLHHYPYTTNKNKIFIYKSIFFGLSGLFICLALYLYYSHLSWTFAFLFRDNMPIKQVICFICGVFCAFSAGLGLLITPEKELALQAVMSAKRQIKKVYRRRLNSISCVHNSSPMGTSHERIVIKHTYEDTLEKLEAFKSETLMTLKRIGISKQLSESQKEHLYNQVILELQFKLELLSTAYLKNDFAAYHIQ